MSTIRPFSKVYVSVGLLLLILSGFWRTSQASQGPAQPAHWQFLGRTSGTAGYAIAGVDHFALVGMGAGIAVYDIQDPHDVKDVGMLPLRDVPLGMAQRGDWLFVADGEAGMVVIDVSQLPTLRVVTAVPTPCEDIELVGDTVWVVDQLEGLIGIDVATPSRPKVVVRRSELVGRKVAATDVTLLVATPQRVVFLDVGNPLQPRTVSEYTVTDRAEGAITDVAAGSGRAWVVQSTSVLIWTVAAGGNVERAGRLEVEDYGLIAIDLAGTSAAILNGTYALQLIDASDAAAPRLVTQIELEIDDRPLISVHLFNGLGLVGSADGFLFVAAVEVPFRQRGIRRLWEHEVEDQILSFAMADSMAYFQTKEALEVWSVADASLPRMVGRLEVADDSYRTRMLLTGHLILLTSNQPELLIIEVKNSAQPRLLARVELPSYALDLAVSGDGSTAYLALDEGGVRILDLRQPDVPRLIGTVQLQGSTKLVAVRGNVAYIVNGTSLHVVDVGSPDHPMLLRTLPGVPEFIGYFARLTFQGNWLAFSHNDGFVLFDVSQPDQPRPIATVDRVEQQINGFAFHGQRAVIGHDESIEVLDLSNLAKPQTLETYAFSGTKDLVISGALVLAVGNTIAETVAFLNVEDPFDVLKSIRRPPKSAWPAEAIAVTADGIAVATDGLAAHVLDLGRAPQPQELAAMSSTVITAEMEQNRAVGMTHVAIQDHSAYIVDTTLLRRFDVSHPEKPIPTGQIEINQLTSGLAVAHGVAHVTFEFGTGSPWLIDGSNPTKLTHAATLENIRLSYSVAVKDTFGFYDNSEAVEVWDNAVPSKPKHLADVKTVGHHLVFDARRDLLYATSRSVLSTIDVAVPGKPKLLFEAPFDEDNPSFDLLPMGDYALWLRKGGLEVFDVRDPASQQLVAVQGRPPQTIVDGTSVTRRGTLRSTTRLAYWRGTVYVADSYGGLLRLKLLEPSIESAGTAYLPWIRR